jgi:hypothetical protein
MAQRMRRGDGTSGARSVSGVVLSALARVGFSHIHVSENVTWNCCSIHSPVAAALH